ncbi:hypothetical protein VTN02DRAFT_3741 [Thermoascus thermophilus]
MDLAVTAERYLFKQLAKTKRIAESPAFAKFKASRPVSIEGPRDTAEANVIARLMKSNPVKNVMPGIMGGIRELLGLDDAAAATDAKKAKASKGEDEGEDGGKDETTPAKPKRDEKKTQAQRREQDEVSSGEEDDGEEGEGSENANDSDEDSIDYSKFDSRLAPSSGESDEGSDPEEEEEDKASNTKPSRYDRARDLSLSPTPSASSSDSPPPTSLKGTKKSAASASASKAPTKSTTFLPSLMMGGYWSGSESEPEDLDSVDPPRRKNRMGQKARRALWEKKYGDKANHIQKEKQKQKQSRDSGWDMRRGATDADGGGDARGRKRGAGAGKPQSGQQGAGPNSNKKSATDRNKAHHQQKKAQMDNKPLHPSWEAARRQKEQKAQASFQGKKIVFD